MFKTSHTRKILKLSRKKNKQRERERAKERTTERRIEILKYITEELKTYKIDLETLKTHTRSLQM